MDDFFAQLNLPKTFNLDSSQLETNYLRACMSIHPDHLQGSGSSFVSVAEISLAKINNAYEKLKNPITRAEHLLLLSGGLAANENKNVSQGFLEQMLNLREKIDDAKSISDRSKLENTINSKIEQSKNQLARLCTLPMNSANKDSLRELLNEISFLQSLEQDLLQQAE